MPPSIKNGVSNTISNAKILGKSGIDTLKKGAENQFNALGASLNLSKQSDNLPESEENEAPSLPTRAAEAAVALNSAYIRGKQVVAAGRAVVATGQALAAFLATPVGFVVGIITLVVVFSFCIILTQQVSNIQSNKGAQLQIGTECFFEDKDNLAGCASRKVVNRSLERVAPELN